MGDICVVDTDYGSRPGYPHRVFCFQEIRCLQWWEGLFVVCGACLANAWLAPAGCYGRVALDPASPELDDR